MGRHVYPSAGCIVERCSDGLCAAPGAGVCGAGFSYPLDIFAVLVAVSAAGGRCCWVIVAGGRRGGICYRVLARHRRTGRAAGRRVGWAAGGGGGAGSGWRAGDVGTRTSERRGGKWL